MTTSDVRIEIVDDSSDRQIGARERVTELLADRADDIRNAIKQTATVVQSSAAVLRRHEDWEVETVQAKFGVKLAAQAGVVLSTASTEASFEVTITVRRREAD